MFWFFAFNWTFGSWHLHGPARKKHFGRVVPGAQPGQAQPGIAAGAPASSPIHPKVEKMSHELRQVDPDLDESTFHVDLTSNFHIPKAHFQGRPNSLQIQWLSLIFFECAQIISDAGRRSKVRLNQALAQHESIHDPSCEVSRQKADALP